jgi:hypothetical protein
MFFELKKKYDSAIKDLELEIRDLENKILENEFNIELLKNNSTINENEKDNLTIKYSLKYNKEEFSPNLIIPKSKKAYDISNDNPKGDKTE